MLTFEEILKEKFEKLLPRKSLNACEISAIKEAFDEVLTRRAERNERKMCKYENSDLGEALTFSGKWIEDLELKKELIK